MKKIKKYFNDNTDEYLLSKNKEYRKNFSQFFTPNDIANFMVENLELSDTLTEIRILEPAAGTGNLILATIKKIINNFKKIKKIYIKAIELDKELCKILISNLKFLQINLTNIVEIRFVVLNDNFINLYGNIWNEEEKLFKMNDEKFDLIISNPPYKKINKNSTENSYFENLIMGQPNIYHLFIALSLKLLVDSGQYILISPKNYLGGKYTENLRKYIFNNFSLINLHLFEERNKIFGNEVLQEVCISHFIKKKIKDIKITYNMDTKKTFSINIEKILLTSSNALLFPRKMKDLCWLNKVPNNWVTLNEQNLRFKIGQVVLFRINNENKKEYTFEVGEVPLLRVNHIFKNNINYCNITGNNRENKIVTLKYNERTKNKVIPNKNYVILRKNVDLSSKEFIKAAIYKKNDLKSLNIAIDNNLAYIEQIDGELSLEKAKAICKFLNTKLFARYYKMLNNSHTINSYEINNMLFPKF